MCDRWRLTKIGEYLKSTAFFFQAVITGLDARTNFLDLLCSKNANISRNTFNWRQQSTINIVAKRKKVTLFSTSWQYAHVFDHMNAVISRCPADIYGSTGMILGHYYFTIKITTIIFYFVYWVSFTGFSRQHVSLHLIHLNYLSI